MNRSPYEVLGVTPSSTQDEIKLAYRNLAKKFHPDINPGKKDTEARFKEINAANEIIGTPEGRLKYEQAELAAKEEQTARANASARSGPYYHQTQQQGARYSSTFDGMDDEMFQSIFGGMGGSSGRSRWDAAGEDARYELEISFKESVLGGEKEITLPSGKRLRVKIPVGVEEGTKLRFAGYGSPGVGNAPSGNAYIELKVAPSTLFKRNKFDLEIEVPVSLSEWIVGSEIKIPTIDGHVLLNVPAGISAARKLRVPGKGVMNTATGKRGDQYVMIHPVLPTSVDNEFKESVKAWQIRQPHDVRSSWIGMTGEKSP